MPVLARLRRRAPVLLTALVAVAIAAPLGALASHQFSDVPDSNLYHNDIDALVDSGVTSGCGGGNYCPSANVTREQMAAFLNRLGALAPGKTPVVNAKTAQDADKLDGIDSTGFLPAATITMSQFGGWTASGVTISHSNSNVDVSKAGSGGTILYLGLTAPESIGGFGYALQSVTVCFAANPNVTITGSALYKIQGAASVATIGDTGDTSLASPACRTMTDLVPDPSGPNAWHLTMSADWAVGGILEIGTIRTVWALTTAVG